jgi:Domain of Unknown Function (DUF1080)
MKHKSFFSLIPACALALAFTTARADEGKSIFNGKDLTGWHGVSEFWSVQDGCITGHTTKEHMVAENTFLIWDGGEPGDFELTFKYKLTDEDGKSDKFGNSGVQYRSKVVKPEYSVVSGYQADMECGKTYSGILYEEKGRSILAKRGEKVVIKNVEPAPVSESASASTDKKKKPAAPKNFKIEVVGSLGKSEDIQAKIHMGEWNDYKIVAKGGHLQHFINGVQTVDVTDETAEGAKKGIIALQLHKGPSGMTVQFKDMVLKELK